MGFFNLEDYETVEERLVKFWADNKSGRVFTRLLESSANRFIVEASIFRSNEDTQAWATGLAEETVQGRGVNATSALENCETSAIGRALANAGYATKGKRASREEMTKVAKGAEVKATIEQTKAKMASTSKEYVPVTKEDDPWTQWEAAPVQTMEGAVETVKSILGGTTEKDIQKCKHGEMVWATGTSKAGKPWAMFKCTVSRQNTQETQCDPVWYEVKADGTWGQQVKRG
jgi:hypothetical protein